MIILDTNVASDPPKSRRDPRVLEWFNRQVESSLYLTAISLMEMSTGVAILPEGRRKETMRMALDDMLAELVTPILPFDRAAALEYASVVVTAKGNLYTLSMADAQIAAIAKVHGFAVATRDVDPFLAAGVNVINPWNEA